MLITFRNLFRAISSPYYAKFLYNSIPCRTFYINDNKPAQSGYRLSNQRFNESRNAEITEFLKRHHIEYSERDSEYTLKYCPFCAKPHNEKADNLSKLNLNKNSGCFFCFRCSSKGSWYDFKKYWDTNGGVKPKTDPSKLGGSRIEALSEMIESPSLGITMDKNKMKSAAERYTALLEKKYPNAISYLTGKNYEKGERGLKLETLEHYKVGLGIEEFRNDENMYSVYESVYFPMYGIRTDYKPDETESEDVKLSRQLMETNTHALKRLKIRAIGKSNKHRQRVDPSGKIWYYLY